MQKDYLTPDLIAWILKDDNDPIWQMGILGQFWKNWYSIVTVSRIGLIHCYGNADIEPFFV